MSDRLGPILARKRRENRRRLQHVGIHDPRRSPPREGLRERALAALRRPNGAPVRVIAEIKFRSPSAGEIRPWSAGEAVRVAHGYAAAGASAISVLADGPGFGGGALTVRRVATAVERPVLFKEFVLDPVQVELARAVGASMVLLLVRALSGAALEELVAGCHAAGLEPVVEAADADEVDVAAATGAQIIGVNARDLSTFRVDPAAAERAIARIPDDRVKVYMSGVDSAPDLARVGALGADAALVGTGLMRRPAPGPHLAGWLSALGGR